MEPVKLDVGLQKIDCSWIRHQMIQSELPAWICHAVSDAETAVPTLIHRRTLGGGTDLSAIAPKKSGASMAASADAAKAHGLSGPSLASSNTLLKGTNQDPSAIPWRNSNPINSIRSAIVSLCSTLIQRDRSNASRC